MLAATVCCGTKIREDLAASSMGMAAFGVVATAGSILMLASGAYTLALMAG